MSPAADFHDPLFPGPRASGTRRSQSPSSSSMSQASEADPSQTGRAACRCDDAVSPQGWHGEQVQARVLFKDRRQILGLNERCGIMVDAPCPSGRIAGFCHRVTENRIIARVISRTSGWPGRSFPGANRGLVACGLRERSRPAPAPCRAPGCHSLARRPARSSPAG